jgi:hypothetical protein
MESEIKINCATHGESVAALVCQHLLAGERLGFNWAYPPENPDAWCPDAWCDKCEAGLEQAGEWTDEMANRANIKLVCMSCYSGIRERNWIQDDSAFEKLRSHAAACLDERQDAFMRDFRIGDYERYDYDQDKAQLMFSSGGKLRLICDVVFAGSISTTSDTWLWSWANDSLLEGVKSRMREVRGYGESHRLERLAGAYWPAQETDGWQMTSIATYLLDGIGAYRVPDENGFIFMVVLKASWAQ